MQNTLTDGPIFTKILSMSFSMMWGFISIIGFNLADTYFIAQLGSDHLASVSLCFPIILFFFSIALGLSTAVSSLVSRSIGKQDKVMIKRFSSDALTLALLIVLISLVVGFIFIKPALQLLGADLVTLPIATDYMNIWFCGMFFLTIPMVGNGAIRANGKMRVASLIMIVGAIINIILDPILIFGYGFIPAMGVQGAALASVFARAITLLASLYFLHIKYEMLDFSIPKMKEAVYSWRKILQIAIPAAASNLLAPISMTIVTAVIARLGNDYLGAYGIVNRIESFALIIVLSLSAAISPLVGQNLGAGKLDRVKKIILTSGIISFCWGATAAVILYVYSYNILSFFTKDEQMISVGTLYLTLIPFSYCLYGLKVISSSFFNTIGRPMMATTIGVLQFIVLFIPLILLGNTFYGIDGIFMAHALTYLVIGLFGAVMIMKQFKSKWEYTID